MRLLDISRQHAHNSALIAKGSIWLLCLWSLLFFSACQPKDSEAVDKLNDTSYYFHYRNLDSVYHYAARAEALSGNYDGGRAEALNNLAFYYTAKMNYKRASLLLDSVSLVTDNQIELLIADVQLMRLCQRKSENKEFYDYHEKAVRRFLRIDEELGALDERQRRRYLYASSEFSIVTSTYYYYVGLERESQQALNKIDPSGDIQKDTAQFLSYLYNVGAGGIITDGTQAEINQKEFDNLIQCYIIAHRQGYKFWEANSLQAMSEHLQPADERKKLIADNLPMMMFVNIDAMPDSLLAGNLALRSMDLFNSFGDVYQIAGAYRTLASCYWQIHDYNSALACLNDALEKNKAISQAPDLVASIREQLSMVYSAVNDKHQSDYNRNIYLDLQEQTRQDRYFESRADQLAKSSAQLNIMILSVVVMIVVVVLLLFAFHRLRRRSDQRNSLASLLEPLERWQKRNDAYMSQMDDKYENINEEYSLNVVHVVNNKRRNLEQRAKISLVNSIIPFIDRMINEIQRLSTRRESDAVREDRYGYIAELTDKITEYNAFLTDWIQMRQGQLNLHIETFPLQPLFDVVAKGRMGFQLKGIRLDVQPTQLSVKADRILTLFMVNTIADNARKFTQQGGTVTVSATEGDKFVEVSVSDTGKGMTEQELSGIFDHKIYNGHGFGLMNCRGIIDKYRKISPIFSVCCLSAESAPGRGSRFFFRLPKGIVRAVMALLVLTSSIASMADNSSEVPQRQQVRQHPTAASAYGRVPPQTAKASVSATATAKSQTADTLGLLRRAANYADSAYYSNISGYYRQTLVFADSCRRCLNEFYLALHPGSRILMLRKGDTSKIPAEVKWFHDSVPTNYSIILDVRNETAVAALALHEWSLYRYNNKVYTLLFKENSADTTLDSYCRMMQRSETNKSVAMVLLVLLLLSIFPAYYFMYYRHRVYYQFCLERVRQINDILLRDSSPDEKLREIRPISTDRFPDELRGIVDKIKVALAEASERDHVSSTNIELADDERRRAEFEDQRLYISNSVLDNCLSTLKHETMYYPSRIRQLVDGKDSNLQSMSELAEYYKELYTILSSQAMRQVESVKLICRQFPLSDVLPREECDADCILRGDKDMIQYLFDILRKQSGGKLNVSVAERDRRYAVFSILLPNLRLSQEDCLQLFTPGKDHQPFLLCRQIARDNGESTNCRGCGIEAQPTADGTLIVVTLAAASRQAAVIRDGKNLE